MRLLLTGATGAIGISLVRHFLKNGVEVVLLVRPRENTEELLKSLFGRPVPFIFGDVTEEMCGVSANDIAELKGRVYAIVHGAGKTQYHEHLRDDTYRANETGTKNTLILADAVGARRFVYLSTSYVAGLMPYLREDETGFVENSNNPYESSKIEAEKLIRAWPGEQVILRLSTVIGDSKTGYVAGVGGYSAFTRGFWVMRSKIGRYPTNPFFVGLNPCSTLNLVPNDWVVDLVRKATLSDVVGTFHLTHTDPVNLGWLFEETFHKGLGLPLTCDRLVAERTAIWKDPTWRKTQEIIVRDIVGYFGPYLWRDTSYGHERVMFIPGYVPPPPIDENVIGAQIEYMIGHLFKKRALEPVVSA